MAAIHVIRPSGGRFVVMMFSNCALTRIAAGGFVRRPSNGGERSIEQRHRKQAENCGGGTATLLRGQLHSRPGPSYVVTNYNVPRHSLKAGLI
jgi:hypothetical protein